MSITHNSYTDGTPRVLLNKKKYTKIHFKITSPRHQTWVLKLWLKTPISLNWQFAKPWLQPLPLLASLARGTLHKPQLPLLSARHSGARSQTTEDSSFPLEPVKLFKLTNPRRPQETQLTSLACLTQAFTLNSSSLLLLSWGQPSVWPCVAPCSHQQLQITKSSVCHVSEGQCVVTHHQKTLKSYKPGPLALFKNY